MENSTKHRPEPFNGDEFDPILPLSSQTLYLYDVEVVPASECDDVPEWCGSVLMLRRKKVVDG